MTLNLNASMFIPKDPKLAAVALLAPMAATFAIRSMQGYDWKIAFQHSCLFSALNVPFFFAQGRLPDKPHRYLYQAACCSSAYYLYKAMETKSPYFMFPAAILSAAQIAGATIPKCTCRYNEGKLPRRID